MGSTWESKPLAFIWSIQSPQQPQVGLLNTVNSVAAARGDRAARGERASRAETSNTFIIQYPFIHSGNRPLQVRSSEPEFNSGQIMNVGDRRTGIVSHIGGFAKSSGPFNTNIGGKLAADFIMQTQT